MEEVSVEEVNVKVYKVRAGSHRAWVTVTYSPEGRPVHIAVESRDRKVELNPYDIDVLAALTKEGKIKWE